MSGSGGKRLALAGVLGVVLMPAGIARAATITVNTTADEQNAGDGRCSLREAISAVDGIGGADCGAVSVSSNTIILGAAHYTLTIPGAGEDANASGDLDLTGPSSALTISGAGAEATTIEAVGTGDRVLDVHLGAPGLTLAGLSITGGRAPAGSPGLPGVSGDGGAGSPGEMGGGIRSQGTLTLIDCTVVGNRAGDGGAGGAGGSSSGVGPTGGSGGPGGAGGGIYDIGALTLTSSTVAGNVAGSGGAGGAGGAGGLSGGGSGASGGSPGSGGGIYDVGSLTVTASTIRSNQAGSGGSGGDGAFGTAGGAGGAGTDNGGDGGGIFSSGSLQMLDSTVAANSAGNGGNGGKGGDGGFGGAHFGGNKGGNGAAGGWGGGISSIEGSLTVINSTITANHAGNAGAGGAGGSDTEGPGGNGGDGGSGEVGGDGGAIRRSLGGSGLLVNVTVAENASGVGGVGGSGGAAGSGKTVGASGPSGTSGVGGGVFETGSGTTLQNTLLASNPIGNCVGPIIDGGHNLSFGDTGCPLTFSSADPKLGALQFNGGPTQTMALGAGSGALDQVPASGANCPGEDQRGVTRPAGGACDIGAFEFAAPTCRPVAASTAAGHAVRVALKCSDPAGATLSYTIDTRAAHGALGAIDATGGVLYTPATGYAGADSFSYHATSVNGVTATASASITVKPAVKPPPPPPKKTQAIVLSERISPNRFRAAPHGASVLAAKHRYGTKVSFVLNEKAMVNFAVVRLKPGRRAKGGQCVRPRRANRHGRRCTRFVPLRGSFALTGKAGASSFIFSGRLAGVRLAPGRYLLIATPRVAKRVGRSAQASFQVLR